MGMAYWVYMMMMMMSVSLDYKSLTVILNPDLTPKQSLITDQNVLIS